MAPEISHPLEMTRTGKTTPQTNVATVKSIACPLPVYLVSPTFFAAAAVPIQLWSFKFLNISITLNSKMYSLDETYTQRISFKYLHSSLNYHTTDQAAETTAPPCGRYVNCYLAYECFCQNKNRKRQTHTEPSEQWSKLLRQTQRRVPVLQAAKITVCFHTKSRPNSRGHEIAFNIVMHFSHSVYLKQASKTPP